MTYDTDNLLPGIDDFLEDAPDDRPSVKVTLPPATSSSSKPVKAAKPDYSAMAKEAANRYGIDPDAFDRQMRQESGYDPDVIHGRRFSKAGAMGIAQFMRPTGRRYGLKGRDFFDPAKSLDAGARYKRFLLDRYDGDERLATAAYNAGEGAVDDFRDGTNKTGKNPKRLKTGGIPPWRETQDYVQKIHGGQQAKPKGNSRNVLPGVEQFLEDSLGQEVTPSALPGIEQFLEDAPSQEQAKPSTSQPVIEPQATLQSGSDSTLQPSFQAPNLPYRPPPPGGMPLRTGEPLPHQVAEDLIEQAHSESQVGMPVQGQVAQPRPLPTADEMAKRRVELSTMAMRQAQSPVDIPGYQEAVTAYNEDIKRLNEQRRTAKGQPQQGQRVQQAQPQPATPSTEPGMDYTPGAPLANRPQPAAPQEPLQKGELDNVTISAGLGIDEKGETPFAPRERERLEYESFKEWQEAINGTKDKPPDWRKASIMARVMEQEFPNGKWARHAYDPITGVNSIPLSQQKEAREGAVAVPMADISHLKGEELRTAVQYRMKAQLGFDDATYKQFVDKYGFEPAALAGYGTGREQIQQTPEQFEEWVRQTSQDDNQVLIRVPKATAEKVQEFFNDKRTSDMTGAMAQEAGRKVKGRMNLIENPYVAALTGMAAFSAQHQADVLGDEFVDAAQQFSAGMAHGLAGIPASTVKFGGIIIRDLARALGGKDTKTPIANFLIESGDYVNKFLKRASYENTSGEGLTAFGVGQGFGSSFSFAAMGGASRFSTAVVGALSEAGTTYDETYDRMIQQGYDPQRAHEIARNAAVLAMPGGTLEATGVGGSVGRALKGGMPGAGFWRNMLGAVGYDVAEESLFQEKTQNMWGNAIAQVAGDPKRRLHDGEATAILTAIFSAAPVSAGTHAVLGANVDAQRDADLTTAESHAEKVRLGQPVTLEETRAARQADARLRSEGDVIKPGKESVQLGIQQRQPFQEAEREDEEPSKLQAKTAAKTEDALHGIREKLADRQFAKLLAKPENAEDRATIAVAEVLVSVRW